MLYNIYYQIFRNYRLQCWSPPPDIGVELRMPLAIDNFRPRAISMLTAGEDRRIYIERQKAQ